MNTAARQWTIALAYVAFIYATLELVPAPLAYLRAHNVLRLTIAIVFVIALAFILKVMYSRTRNALRYLGLFALIGLYAWAVALVKRPEEKIHFLQYGLVGVLFVRALRNHLSKNVLAFGGALLLAACAGWLDEIIQGLLPNRHYDLRDIYLDAGAAFLGLLVYALVPHEPARSTEKTAA